MGYRIFLNLFRLLRSLNPSRSTAVIQSMKLDGLPPIRRIAKSCGIRSITLLVAGAAVALFTSAAQARFEKLADLETVSVSTEPNFLSNAGPQLLRTWILLDFKEAQNFEVSPDPMNPKAALSYRSRKDYVQVDCRHNLYTELATQMFPQAEGKGKSVFESTFHRSGQPRFATPSSHEGAVLVFLCRGIRPN